MHSFLSRLNATFAFAFSCLGMVTLLCFLTTVFDVPTPDVSIQVSDISVQQLPEFYRRSRKKSDFGNVTFDLNADLTSVFNWNTKQLFLYVMAEYETEKNVFNQVVIWDKIILRGDGNEVIRAQRLRKYPFFDDGNGLKGNTNVTLSLNWNAIPHAGLLPRLGSGHVVIEFPDWYRQ
eukprot:m.485214 g.485214  ORF g.485214 m.485214 type:complete len:177 (-) comp23704_c0_seq1:35-565(-)